MIISPGRNYIFVHIPKTGGTSLALALEARAKADDIMLGDTPKAKKRRRRLKDAQSAGRLWKHSTLADIDGLVAPDFIAGAFCFTLVRNPWDRMVSYYHWLREQTFQHSVVSLARQLAFRDFASHPAILNSMRASPYAHYMTDTRGKNRASLYIRLEHFAEDSAPLWEHLGFQLALPHENASAREASYREYYDTDLRTLVGDACARDIAEFGYEF